MPSLCWILAFLNPGGCSWKISFDGWMNSGILIGIDGRYLYRFLDLQDNIMVHYNAIITIRFRPVLYVQRYDGCSPCRRHDVHIFLCSDERRIRTFRIGLWLAWLLVYPLLWAFPSRWETFLISWSQEWTSQFWQLLSRVSHGRQAKSRWSLLQQRSIAPFSKRVITRGLEGEWCHQRG